MCFFKNYNSYDRRKLLLSFTATAHAAENDYLIKLINTFDNEKQEDIFRTMHDPNHRHPRHRGTQFADLN